MVDPEGEPMGRPIDLTRFYGLDGERITLKQWIANRGDPALWVIGKDRVGIFTVSTVYLGIDHSFGGSVPMIFETMIFGDHIETDGIRLRPDGRSTGATGTASATPPQPGRWRVTTGQ